MSESLYSSLLAQAALYGDDHLPREALKSLDEAVEIARSSFGKRDKRLAAALELRSAVHKTLGTALDAERDMHEAVSIRLALMGRTADSLSIQQKYAEAEKLYRESLDVCTRTFGRHHRETATCLDNLATNLRSQSRFQEAFLHAHEALELRQAVLGDDHTHTATSFSNVGYLHRLLGRYDEALERLVMSLQIRERHKGPDHPLVAESLDRIASVYRDTGRFAEALPLCERALRIRLDKLGPDHPLTAASKNNKALILERRSDEMAAPVAKKSDPATNAAGPARTTSSPPSRESHAAGYAIVAAVAGGLPLAGVLFWLVPWLGIATGVTVVFATLLGILAPAATDVFVRRLTNAVWKRLQDSEPDSVLLGRRGGKAIEIGSSPRSGSLTLEDVQAFPVKAASDTLDLHWVKSMSVPAADALAAMRCGLNINALQDLPSKLAKSLRVHEGRLELNGIASLTVPAAMAIARHQGPSLQLNGLAEVGKGVAEQLAHHRGTLSLDGLRSLDDDAATWLVKHRGDLSLMGLQLVSRQTVRILRSSPSIRLPDDLGEGI